MRGIKRVSSCQFPILSDTMQAVLVHCLEAISLNKISVKFVTTQSSLHLYVCDLLPIFHNGVL